MGKWTNGHMEAPVNRFTCNLIYKHLFSWWIGLILLSACPAFAQRNPIVDQILIEGNVAISSERVQNLMVTKSGGLIRKKRLNFPDLIGDLEAIENVYRNSGFLDARVRQFQVVTSEDQSVLYAEGSGDRFPIHTDDSFARAVGLPGKIMHGMCTLALSVNASMANPVALKSLECRFANIMLPGDSLSVHVVEEGAGRQFESRRSDGKPVITEGHCT